MAINRSNTPANQNQVSPPTLFDWWDWNEEDRVGGHVLLDFLNTVSDTDKGRGTNMFGGWSDILSWAERVDLIEGDAAAELETVDGADAAFDGLMVVREQFHAFLSAHAAGKEASHPEIVEDLIRRTMGVSTLHRREGLLEWRPVVESGDPAVIGHRLVLTFADLISGPDLARLRECGRCSWMFLNKGRGVGRRWCRMSACGNRAKTAAYRAAHQ